IIEEESVAALRADRFQVLVTFMVDPGLVTAASADCELEPGEEGTGLLNTAGVSGGVPPQWDDDCREIPNPAVEIVKTVTAGPTPTGNVNEYEITYHVVVTNNSGTWAFYNLSDTLKYGAGAIIGDVEVAYVAGGDGLGASLNPNFTGQPGNYLIVTNETI